MNLVAVSLAFIFGCLTGLVLSALCIVSGADDRLREKQNGKEDIF